MSPCCTLQACLVEVRNSCLAQITVGRLLHPYPCSSMLEWLKRSRRPTEPPPPPPPVKMPTDGVAHLRELPDELLLYLALRLQNAHPRAALRLTATCTDFSHRLNEVKDNVGQLRMRWAENRHVDDGSIVISDSGNALTLTSRKLWKSGQHTIAQGWKNVVCDSMLPTMGCSTWAVKLGGPRSGYVQAGVATEDGSSAWSLCLYSWHVRRVSWEETLAPPPEGYPEVTGTPVQGERARGSLCSHILVSFDHEHGKLSWQVILDSAGGELEGLEPTMDEGAVGSAELDGFPAGALLRPCVALYEKGDRVVLQGC